MLDHIYVKGARENNLKNVDVNIPRDKLVVLTGLSGSGKSSLAFDTIYAEGQRRYVESLSSYARMFLGQMEKPDVDYIDGLSPAISIDQKTTSKNPRSTVGTVTEIYDYLRLLWARVGTPHCPKCGKEIRQQTIDQIIDPCSFISASASVIRRRICPPRRVSGREATPPMPPIPACWPSNQIWKGISSILATSLPCSSIAALVVSWVISGSFSTLSRIFTGSIGYQNAIELIRSAASHSSRWIGLYCMDASL